MSFDSPWFTVLLITLIVLALVVYCYHTGAVYDKYKKNGIRTEANIVSKEKIGASGTGNTKFRVVVSFTTANGSVTATTKRYFTPEDLIKVMRNNTVVLYYLPEDPQKVLLMPNEMV
ncbi:DUF3592 domain-containing protein [Kosakonia sp.]|uniref:DUF3592 domain-containing protein n=1 Tax=Kosakonia sp. TaxID=1916651 RepID=UPI002898781D|nr:DUF3592 domain-containing protein [Kosakonia sp.]